MLFNPPEPGCVICHSYLWHYEYHAGMEEGRKNRPCLIVLATEVNDGKMMVTVVPITHSVPGDMDTSIEIPPKVKAHLNLDSARSWVILNEVNQFAWPGYDLRPTPGESNSYEFGFIPPRLFDEIKRKMIAIYDKSRLAIISRD